MATAVRLEDLLANIPEEVRPPRFDPFHPLSGEARARQLAHCLSHLEKRDGPLDFEAQVLPRREAQLVQLHADRVVWRQSGEHDGQRAIWLAGLTKANESESWGAEGEYRRLRRHGTQGVDRRELYVLIEEQYHRRLLAEACRTCGIEPQDPKPPRTIRALITVMQHMPGSIRYAPILCGEVLGCVVFQELLDRCHLFSDQPAVQARLQVLIEEILADEILHVLYSRARLGAAGVRAARLLLPVVAAVFTRAIPQLLELGCRREHLVERVRSGLPLPPSLAWAEAEPR